MTPRKKITEEYEKEIEEVKADPDEETIASIVESLGVENLRCRVYRQDTYGRPRFVTSLPATYISEEFLQEKFGGGAYVVHFLNEKGQYAKSKTLRIENPVDSPAVEPASEKWMPQPPENAPPAEPGFGQMEMIREEMRSQKELMLELIRQIGNNNRNSTLNELAQAIAMLRETTAPPAGGASVVSEMIGILKQGIEIGASGGVPEKSWKDIAYDALKVAPAFLSQLRGAPEGGGTHPNGGEDPMIQNLRAMIAYLKPKAMAHKDVGLWVDVVMDNREDPQWQPLLAYINVPYEVLAQKVDPELLDPRYRPWFEGLFMGIKNALTASQIPGDVDSDGSGGDGDDASVDEEPGTNQPGL